MEILHKGAISWYILLNLLGNAVSFTLAAFLARRYSRYFLSGLLANEDNEGELGDHEYVLYLRQFAMDRRLFRVDPVGGRNFLSSFIYSFGIGNPINSEQTREENALYQFRRFGQVIAVGRPGERFPMPGAQRFYLPQENWKLAVGDMMQQARLILFLAGLHSKNESAEGTLWELAEAVRRVPPNRVFLFVCGEAGEYNHFREATETYFRDLASRTHQAGEASALFPPLPAYPPLHNPKKLKKAIPLNGVIRFNPDWSSEFIFFDPTKERGWTHRSRWRSTIRNQLNPFAERIEQILPGHATWSKTPFLQILTRGRVWLAAAVSVIAVREFTESHTLEAYEKWGIGGVILVTTAGFVWQDFLTARYVDLFNVTVTSSERVE
ncbi:hypothetical protein ACFV80_08260 [Streptomyces sp. NPDC059862]|uniref:hypothetical protein n=1 Tax=Streptomyces sp. NPDC059862 TaxID=3346975 RepID=UPI00365E68A5